MIGFVVTVVLGIGRIPGTFQSGPAKPASKEEVPRQAISALDAQVLEVVLRDLITYRGEDAPMEYKEKVLFTPDAILAPVTIKYMLYQWEGYEKAWNKLTLSETKAI
jgi:hypothetical protein